MRFSINFPKRPIFFFLCSLPLVSCGTQQLKSSDFTEAFAFTKGIEGPAVDGKGNLYAVNFKEEGTIGIVNAKGKGRIFLKLPNNSVGNGIRFDRAGNMFVADYVSHTVYKVPKGTNTPLVWVREPKMNQPNDLVVVADGTLYLSDPDWKNKNGKLWMVNPEKKVILLEDNMGTTNGLEVDPSGKFLYVNESVQRTIWRYQIRENGRLFDKTRFMTFPDFGLDGMRCDEKGNLYITRHGKGTVLIVSPDKEIIKEVDLKGKKPSNITFGGKNGRTCYVTMADRGCFEQFRAPYKGAHFRKE